MEEQGQKEQVTTKIVFGFVEGDQQNRSPSGMQLEANGVPSEIAGAMSWS
jgi:hypothetical protein